MKESQALFYRIVLCLMLLFVAAVLATCINPTPTPAAMTPVALIASLTATPSPTPIPPSPTSTLTRTPTSTRTRIPSPTATPQPTSTPTPTTYPTLDSQGRLNFVLQALKTNGGCELPCWWGITPGKTTWEEMIRTFAKQGIGFSEEGKLDLDLTTKDNHRQETIDVTFQKGHDFVQSINIKTNYYDLLAQQEYSEDWRNYTLDQVLTRYGVPTQVYLELRIGAADWTPGMTSDYSLWVEYADKGLALEYPGELVNDNQEYHVCSMFGHVGGIEIQLRVQDVQTPLVNLEPIVYFGFNGSLKKLTGMNRQAFYEMFRQNPPPGCLRVTDPSPWYDAIALPKASMILPIPQEEEYLVNNLASNDDCELPCWWGIKPGETTTQYVQQMFLNLGKSVSRNEDDRGLQYQVSLFGRHSPYPFDYTVKHRWFDENGIVSLFGVTGSALNWSPPQHFTQDWNRYALHKALARYGVPTKVLVHYWGFGWRYDITLVYEDKGFLIRYSGPIVDEGNEFSKEPVIICPTQNAPTEITVWMTKPASTALAKFEYGRWDLSPSHSPMPSLKEVTNMTVQKFYETFLNPDATACLTVPRAKGELAP